MTGQHDDRRLEAAAAQELHRLAAIHVGQADIHDQEVDRVVARRLHALRGGLFLQHMEFFIETQLLDQHLAQVVIVIHQQNCPGAHQPKALASNLIRFLNHRRTNENNCPSDFQCRANRQVVDHGQSKAS